MTQHHGSPDDPSLLSGESVEAIASALPGAEAVLAPLARQEFVSFLLDLGTGRMLAATAAAARLAIAPGEPAPEPVMTAATRLARRTAAGFGVARLRLPGDLSPRTLRFAALALPSGPAILFADPAAFAPAPPSPALPAAAPAVPAALRPLLAQPLRVTWESDADGRLRALSPLFAAALGSRSGAFLGASFAELERDGHLADADALIDAMASGESFTERTATVPPVGVESPLDLSLGGAPLFDAERRLKGVRGFGIVSAAETPLPLPPPKAPEASAPAPQPPVAFGRNVVPLRQGSLSPQESSAFREIARTLAAAIEDWPRIPPDTNPPDQMDAAYAEPEPAPASGDEAELLDKLPVSLLVQQEGELVHANRAFLALTGWSGLDALAEAGGLERVLSRESGALHVLTPDGARLPVEVRLVAAPFLGRPALIHVIRALDTTDDDREARASARRAALDMVPWPVFLLEMDGTIRLANFAAAERLGFPAHDLAGEPFTIAVAPTDRADAVATLDRVRDDGASAQVALALRNREGEMLPGLAAVTRAGAEDQILCVVIGPVPQQPEAVPMALPVAVPEPEPAVNLLPRLAGRLRAGLEGPMTILREAPAEALSDPLRDALKSLNATLDDLSALSQPAQTAEAVTCDVSAAVRAAVTSFLPAARRRRLALRLDDAGGVTALAAEAPLEELVAMLVEEAVAATPAGGAVAVSVFTEDEGDGGPRAKVQLSDAGAGLDATAATAALDPLSGLSPDDRFAADGRPLRLTRMAEAARALGGSLEIDPVGMSQAGEDLGRRRGMIARLTLPA
ncbi:PAS domain-containing protein [Xanthobacter aminoxidans]|uniref:PAS domain-containing protein n=1 Tax=Xanthobacter aminoxidans TaxID=186280 RepID=UPI00372AFEAD